MSMKRRMFDIRRRNGFISSCRCHIIKRLIRRSIVRIVSVRGIAIIAIIHIKILSDLLSWWIYKLILPHKLFCIIVAAV